MPLAPLRVGRRERTSTPVEGSDAVLAVRAQGSGLLNLIARYVSLTKPRVLGGNVLTTVAGFALASAGRYRILELIFVTVGTTLLIASACVVNNILDRDIDKSMARTRRRATVTGTVSVRSSAMFAVALGVAGLITLVRGTGLLVAAVGASGFVVYVVLYGMWSKRTSRHGTLVGSVSGAIPVLAGYVAVTGRIDGAAVTASFMMFFWQEPDRDLPSGRVQDRGRSGRYCRTRRSPYQASHPYLHGSLQRDRLDPAAVQRGRDRLHLRDGTHLRHLACHRHLRARSP